MKHHELGKKLPKNTEDHFEMVNSALGKLAGAVEMIRGFFSDPHLKYIKAGDFCTP